MLTIAGLEDWNSIRCLGAGVVEAVLLAAGNSGRLELVRVLA